MSSYSKSARWTVLPAFMLTMLGCARPNPLYEPGIGAHGDTGFPGNGAHEDTGFDSGPSAMLDVGAGTDTVMDASTGGDDMAVVYMFATEPTNGSIGGEGSGVSEGLEGARFMCAKAAADVSAPCSTEPVVLLSTGSNLTELVESLPDDTPVVSVSEVRLAGAVGALLEGPLERSLTEASVVAPDVFGVWTGANPDASNCAGWTSGNSDRSGGLGSVGGEQDWTAASSDSCGERHPLLCLCL